MVYTHYPPGIKENIWRVNLKPEDVQKIPITSTFWKDVLTAWCEFNYWHNQDISNQLLWLNSNIQVGNQPIIWKNCVEKGLWYIHQLFRQGRMISQQEAKEEFNIDIMRYNSLVGAIPQEYKRHLTYQSTTNYMPTKPTQL